MCENCLWRFLQFYQISSIIYQILSNQKNKNKKTKKKNQSFFCREWYDCVRNRDTTFIWQKLILNLLGVKFLLAKSKNHLHGIIQKDGTRKKKLIWQHSSIRYQILLAKMVKSVWQKERRIAILEVKDQALFMTKRMSNPEILSSTDAILCKLKVWKLV